MRYATLLLLLGLPVASVYGELKLPAVVSDNMVLERQQANPIWGWANPGEEVVVRIGEHTARGKAGKDGRWQVTLAELPASREPAEMTVRSSSGSKRVLRNVLVGEVWLCTGPSNIHWSVKRCDNADREMETATYPAIRFFTVKKKLARKPLRDCEGEWFACSPQTVGEVSGVGYFFARTIHEQEEVPVGILQSFWGGSRTEAWTSQEALRAEPSLKPLLAWWEHERAGYDADRANSDYQRQLQNWTQRARQAEQQGGKAPRRPKQPTPPESSRHHPGALYNGMIAPLIPYGIRGVISYPGLGNLFWAQHSRVLLSTMIRDWRARWEQGPFPFGMVQPAPFPCDRWPSQCENAYSLLRESQLLVLEDLPNTGVAPTTDLGDLKNLHFTNKQTVGQRLARWALASVYGRDVPSSGPVYRSMTVEGNRIRIRFSHAAGGLSTRDGLGPSHFTIAGKERTFHPATAVIEGESVVVSSEAVPKPVFVRFAWSDTAIPNLVNREGLPASLFRAAMPDRDNRTSRRAE